MIQCSACGYWCHFLYSRDGNSVYCYSYSLEAYYGSLYYSGLLTCRCGVLVSLANFIKSQNSQHTIFKMTDERRMEQLL